ncbi:MAG: hypothetical protein JNM25_18020 [Planctomycetes bacterium]|nr:hypothetical protein [Planctomycetota bacterium]
MSKDVSPTMLNVRDKARELGVQPVDLVRELVDDGVEVLPVSKRSYRVDSVEFEQWRQQRQKRLAERFQQAKRRADHVRGADTEKPKRRAVFTR